MKPFQVGMLIPWVNTAMEEEIPYLIHPDIGLHWARLRPEFLPKDGHDSSYLEQIIKSIPKALSRFDGLQLNITILGCTSISFINDCVNVQISKERGENKIISTFDIVLIQLNRMKSERILLLAPYEEKIIEEEVKQLREKGINVIKAISIPYEKEIRFITPKMIAELITKEFDTKYDCIFLSCTGMYTVDFITEFRKGHNGISIISSNTAIAEFLNNLCVHSLKITESNSGAYD